MSPGLWNNANHHGIFHQSPPIWWTLVNRTRRWRLTSDNRHDQSHAYSCKDQYLYQTRCKRTSKERTKTLERTSTRVFSRLWRYFHKKGLWQITPSLSLGSRNRTFTKNGRKIGLQNLSLIPRRTTITWWISRWTIMNWMNKTIQIANGLPLFLHQEERWSLMTSSRLPKTQWHNNQKLISLTLDQQTYWYTPKCQILHQIGCSMGIQ